MLNWIDGLYGLLGGWGYPHPIHPTQVHMVVGLLVGAAVFALLAGILRKSSLSRTARHCFLLASFFLVPTVVTGIMDWQHFLSGVWMFPIQAKLALSCLLALLLGAGCLLGRGGREGSGGVRAVYFLCFITVGCLGYFGGSLVYGTPPARNGKVYAEGQAIFESTCSGCHPGGGNVMAPSKPVRGSARLKDFDTFLAWIRNPAPPMPPYPSSVLPDDQVKDLHDYLANAWNPN